MLDLLSKGTVNGTAWRLKKDGKVRNLATFHDGMDHNIDHTTQLGVTVYTANMHSWTVIYSYTKIFLLLGRGNFVWGTQNYSSIIGGVILCVLMEGKFCVV